MTIQQEQLKEIVAKAKESLSGKITGEEKKQFAIEHLQKLISESKSDSQKTMYQKMIEKIQK